VVFERGAVRWRKRIAVPVKVLDQIAFPIIRDSVSQDQVVHSSGNVDRVDLDVAVMGDRGGDVWCRLIKKMDASEESTREFGWNSERQGHPRRTQFMAQGRWRLKTKANDSPSLFPTKSYWRPVLAGRTILGRVAVVRIVIVEDHEMFREVLRKVCARDLRHEVVGEAADGRGAVQLVFQAAPDLVLLDLHLPKLDGFGVVEAIRRAAPEIKILVLSSHCDDYTVFRAERARVNGFVDKNTNTVAVLKKAITEVGAGRTFFSPEFLRLKEARHDNPASFDKLLTDRERSVLALIGEPFQDWEIAIRLGLAETTVEKHRFNILRKLGLSTTVELVRYARDHGFTLAALRRDGGGLLP